MGHYMLVSICKMPLCIEAGKLKCDFEDASLCQKNVKTEPLSGSTTPRDTDSSLALRVKMCLYITAQLLERATDHYRKARKLCLPQLAVTKVGKHRKSPRLSPPQNNLLKSNQQNKLKASALADQRSRFSLPRLVSPEQWPGKFSQGFIASPAILNQESQQVLLQELESEKNGRINRAISVPAETRRTDISCLYTNPVLALLVIPT